MSGPFLQPKDILAHRGTWHAVSEKNTKQAITKALLGGFGLETDIRDLDGELVISHDPPSLKSAEILTLDWLFGFYAEHQCVGLLALNIKSDGLAEGLKSAAERHGIPDASFVAFDMSVPDMLLYRDLRVPFYSRLSEYEEQPALFEDCQGVWVDNFTGSYDQMDAARRALSAQKVAAFVSPELHRRPHLDFWNALSDAQWADPSALQICTDFPDKCIEFFTRGLS